MSSGAPQKYFRGEIIKHLSRAISRVVNLQQNLHPQFRKSPVIDNASNQQNLLFIV